MSAAENKKLVQQIFDQLAKGNARPFVDSMAEDFKWTIAGSTQWSRTYEGKHAVVKELFGELQARLTPPIITAAHNFIADEDCVAVEARGSNTTKDGRPYNNHYCFVFRLAGGKLRQVTEYMDTHLAITALGNPTS